MPLRNCTYYALLTLITVQVTIGAMAIIFGEYSKKTIIETLVTHDDRIFRAKLLLFQLYGLHICLIYSAAIPLARKYSQDPYTNHLAALLILWNFFAFITSLDGFIIDWAINWSGLDRLTDIIEKSMYDTIDQYYDDSSYRVRWDNLQYTRHCCGINGFADWTDIKAVDMIRSINKQKRKPNLIPYSCCRQSVDCYEKRIVQTSTSLWLEIPSVNITSINRKGCLPSIVGRLQTANLAMEIVIVIVLSLQVIKAVHTGFLVI